MSGSIRELPTSIGPPLQFDGEVWSIDVRHVPTLHGLSVLSRALSEMVTAQARGDRLEVTVDRRLRDKENPELIAEFGIESVRLTAEPDSLREIVSAPDTPEAIARATESFEKRLRALLGSLQRKRYRDALLCADRAASKALVAEFDDGEPQRFVLERLSGKRDSIRSAFRITVEGRSARRLDLDAIPHVRIEDVADRSFIAGSTRIAQTWTEALRREAERGRRTFSEQRSAHSHLFKQIDQAGLAMLQRVSLQWSETAQSFLLESDPDDVSAMLKRVLLACEDRQLRNLVASRAIVRVDTGSLPVYLDVAQLGRVLELSIGARRERPHADAFLDRTRQLCAVANARAADKPLAGVRVFLVHHMTAEIVATIAALRSLGCRDLVTLFVTYSGEPPASYLDAVLDLPPDEFAALALVNVPTPGHVEGHYRLSTHYSQLTESDAIAKALETRGREYLTAMRAAAVVPFLAQAARAEAAGDRMLLIEDGGYLGPVLQDAMLRGITVGQFATEQGHAHVDDRAIAGAFGQRLIATVEHTRNGFDRIAAVEQKHGRLALPAYSIAISKLKREVESREVAASVLAAVETVLHAEGRILSRRSALVLGSRGAIGRELVRSLQARLDDAQECLHGIDLRAADGDSKIAAETKTMAELPDARWLATDLVLGVTGDSVIQGRDVERWLRHGARDTLVLASGSTKKVEFRDLMVWFDRLCNAPTSSIDGVSVKARSEELLDPRTARLYGHRWQFHFADGRRRTVLALGNLTPINFLFYGVATELIDEVLAQLMTVTLGSVANDREGNRPQCLMAVDRDCDADARSIDRSAAEPRGLAK